MTMPFRKNFGFKREPPGVTTGDDRVSPSREYSAGVRDDPMTVVLSPTCPYGRGAPTDGYADGDEGIETTPRVPEGRRLDPMLVAEGGFEPPTKGL